ncbi:MAG: histidine phosphatase family protein [Saprospiraceae bacterium]|nr:histidine phosphatase family protein [Saprospiraceae bacterium]
MKEIFILRHGETDHNLKGIVQGSGINSVLNSNGLLQSKLFYDSHSNQNFDIFIHSNLIRTEQTIQHFLQYKTPRIIEERIREISWGEHEGKAGEPELMEKYYKIINAWQKGDYTAKPHNGESAQELGNRLNSFLDDLEKMDFSKALICTHGRTLRAMICLFKKWPLSRMEEVGHNNTGLYILRKNNTEWTVVRENDLTHLECLK